MMRHEHQFKNRAIQPTAIVSTPGFGSGLMLGSLAVAHAMERELTAALLVSPPLTLPAFEEWRKKNIRLIEPRNFNEFKNAVTLFLSAAHTEGRANIFIGVRELDLFGEKQALEFIDSLDMNGATVRLVYTTYTNCHEVTQ